eukprot:c16164_g1_i6.p1 GENE.c16164_g1_i6~~c16164_g1_i6.p1  ORF type:complete len:116 (+),score=1.47 c16164_g1_i6:187-534(+)
MSNLEVDFPHQKPCSALSSMALVGTVRVPQFDEHHLQSLSKLGSAKGDVIVSNEHQSVDNFKHMSHIGAPHRSQCQPTRLRRRTRLLLQCRFHSRRKFGVRTRTRKSTPRRATPF